MMDQTDQYFRSHFIPNSHYSADLFISTNSFKSDSSLLCKYKLSMQWNWDVEIHLNPIKFTSLLLRFIHSSCFQLPFWTAATPFTSIWLLASLYYIYQPVTQLVYLILFSIGDLPHSLILNYCLNAICCYQCLIAGGSSIYTLKCIYIPSLLFDCWLDIW